MSDLKLVIGDKNSSTWSLCAWLTLKQLGLEFEEVVIARHLPDARERILQHSPSGKLPLLVAGEIKVWDSLAINEFLADHFDGLWPAGAAARAAARSVAAEAHSGFRDLHTFLPMDVTARFGPPGRLLSGVAADVRRLAAIWHDCRGRFGDGGPFLAGEFSIADAMMAPVCAKLMTYAVPLDELCREYVGHVASLPAMLEWAEGAAAEVAAVAPSVAAAAPPRPAAMPAVAAPGGARPLPVVEDEEEEREAADETPPPPDEAATPEGDEAGDDDGPPAPGLPGVVATRRYTGEKEPEPASGTDVPPRRLVRPPVPGGLVPGGLVPRRASPMMAEPPPKPEPPPLPPREVVTGRPFAAPTAAAPRPVAPPPPAPAAARSPAEASRPRPLSLPATRPPEPPARPAMPVAPRDPREWARGGAEPPPAQLVVATPEAARAEPPPAEAEAPTPAARPTAAPPAAKPAFRPETIKPIGTGTRRRR